MERYTRKDAEKAFELFCAATGERIATSHRDVGGLVLDYAACYGGYEIQRIANEQGGVSMPFGHERMPARQFVSTLRFARYVVDALKVQRPTLKDWIEAQS